MNHYLELSHGAMHRSWAILTLLGSIGVVYSSSSLSLPPAIYFIPSPQILRSSCIDPYFPICCILSSLPVSEPSSKKVKIHNLKAPTLVFEAKSQSSFYLLFNVWSGDDEGERHGGCVPLNSMAGFRALERTLRRRATQALRTSSPWRWGWSHLQLTLCQCASSIAWVSNPVGDKKTKECVRSECNEWYILFSNEEQV